jgi:hypothetical protein
MPRTRSSEMTNVTHRLEPSIGIGITKLGNIGWIMTPEFEALVLEQLEANDCLAIIDEVKDARRAAGLKGTPK